jgi:CRP-like cAMP-binding protein
MLLADYIDNASPMTSKKLRKYLAYYQKTLRDEPDNIEARLRLAAIFRDMGRQAHAVEEYVTASKLLAREGLPLEAIAACKAVLELEPQHTETQLFLARLFARVPDAAGGGARIARPVEPEQQGGARRTGPQESLASVPSSAAKAGSEPITLGQPKSSPASSQQANSKQVDSIQADADPSVHEQETAVSSSGLVEPDLDGPQDSGIEEVPLEKTRQAGMGELPDLEELRVTEEREETQQLGSVSRRPSEDAQDQQGQDQEDHRSTVEMEATDRESVLRAMAGVRNPNSEISSEASGDQSRDDDATDIRTTIDIADEDIVGEDLVGEDLVGEERGEDAPPSPIRERDIDRGRRQTSPVGREPVRPRQGRVETEFGIPSVGDDEPDTQEFEVDDVDDEDGWEETFEVGVFDMESLRLDRESTGDWDDLSFLDELDEPDTSEVAAAMTSPHESSLLSVSRSDLPEIPLFSRLEPSVFMELLRVMDLNEVAAGTPIVEPGRTERSLFVIVRGAAVVTRTLDDQTTVELARLGEGEFFGEFALLTGRSQMATVSAQTPMALLEVRQDVLELVAEEHPEIWDVLWDFYHARMLNNMLASSTIFRSLTNEQRHALAEKFSLEEVPGGELLLGEGDRDFDLYLICSGQVRVEREVGGGLPQELDLLREGEFVGLVSSAEEEPVVANLRATCDTTLLVLPGNEFRCILEQNPRIDREVRQTVRERKAVAGRYTSGVTSYAELGLAPHADSTD